MSKIWILLITMVILFSACKKESQNSIPNPPVPVVLDSNYIDTLYKTLTRGGTTDTVIYFKYIYDGSKRVSLIKWEANSFMQPVTQVGSETYFYNTNDSLPYKSVRLTIGNVNDTIVFFHYYDNVGRLIKDSAVNHRKNPTSGYYFERTHLITYQYMSSMTLKNETDIPIFDPANNITYVYKDTAMLSAGGNPTSSVRYLGLNYWTMTVTYDNMPNPHKKLNIFNSFPPVPDIVQPAFYTSFIGQNNIVTYTVFSVFPTNYNATTTFTHTYRSNNFLLRSVTPSPFTPGDIETLLYKYKAL